MTLTGYQIACLCAVPSLFSALVLFLVRKSTHHISKTVREFRDENDAVKKATCAMLRTNMIHMYNKGMKRGYAPIYEKSNFEDCFNQYVRLGGNGVMCELHEKWQQLPTQIDDGFQN